MKRFAGTVICLLLWCVAAWSQAWVAQAKKAIFSIITYDAEGRIKSTGNGFYITTDGVGVSDYKLFLGASKAVVVDCDGKQSYVQYVMGANDMYDVIKFKVANSQPTASLTVAPTQGTAGQAAYLLPYNTQKNATAQKLSIKEVQTVSDKYAFYTLSASLSEKNVSCPLLNDKGQVLGLAQKGTDSECYGMAADYAQQLSINPLASNDYALNNLSVLTGLPEGCDEALVYLMTVRGRANYPGQLELFIQQYPDNAEGYLRRGTLRMEMGQFEAAEEDLNTYLEKNTDKADAHYNIGFLIYNKERYMPEVTYKDWNKEKALSEMEAAISIQPTPVYIKMKADVLYFLERYEEAYQTYDSLKDTELDGPVIWSFMAQCKTDMGAPEEEIIALFDKAMSQYSKPYNEEASPYLYNRGIHLSRAGRYREAVNDFNDLEHIYSGYGTSDFYLERAKAEKQCKMYQQALDDLMEAQKLAPQNEEVLMEKAALHITIKDYEGAMATAQQLIELDGNSPYGYRFLGFAQVCNKQKAAGKANLLKAKELGDPNAEVIIEKYCK